MFTPVVPAQTQSRPVLGKEPASDPHERQMMWGIDVITSYPPSPFHTVPDSSFCLCKRRNERGDTGQRTI